jgi:hypothetical protein
MMMDEVNSEADLNSSITIRKEEVRNIMLILLREGENDFRLKSQF